MQKETQEVFVHRAVYDYIVSLAEATREHPLISLGIKPPEVLLRQCRWRRRGAGMAGRGFVVPDDVAGVFHDIARHRILLSAQAKAGNMTADDVLDEILETVKKPRPEKR